MDHGIDKFADKFKNYLQKKSFLQMREENDEKPSFEWTTE